MATTTSAASAATTKESAASASTAASWIDYDVSAEFLHRELAAAERALQHNEEKQREKKKKKQHQKQQKNINDDYFSAEEDQDDHYEQQEANMMTPTTERLFRMDCAASELLLVQDISEWSKSSRREHENEESEDFWTAHCCEALGRLLVRHAAVQASDIATVDTDETGRMSSATTTTTSTTSTRLYSNLVQYEYLPLYEYINMTLILLLRQTLRECGYPSKATTFIILAKTTKYLLQLQRTHKSVLQHVLPKIQQSQLQPLQQHVQDNVILMELMRPIVERVRYHFVESSSSSHKSSSSNSADSSLTFSRLDRLPEWLVRYLKDTIFGGGGGQGGITATTEDSPFDVVSSLALYIQSNDNNNNDLVLDFLNEIVRLVQWVLNKRNFFQHASVIGQHSKPIILMNAIEQLLQLDALLQQSLSLVPQQQQQQQRNRRLLSLMDIFVAGNDELCTWWLEREREALYYTIFSDDNEDNNKNRLLTCIAPRTEIFCALIQSVQQKALLFNFSSPYLQHVAVPLCMQFLDALHEKANLLKSTLSKTPSRHLSLSEANERLENCIRDWIELINGTHLCAMTILKRRDSGNDGSGGDYSTAAVASGEADPDLERIGKSLQHVESVLCDEFCSVFVETVLMERAKLAVYLMKCSHILCSSTDNQHTGDNNMIEVSHDLQESWRLLTIFLQLCEEPEQDGPPSPPHIPLLQQDEYNDDNNNGHILACHAPRRLRHAVLDLISEKFLEVALDPHEMSSPDILQTGCRIFLSDMQAYFGFIPCPERVPKSCLRLLNVAQIMAMPSPALAALGNALVELVQLPPPLHVESFSMDEQLYNQAMSMIQAKGWVWIEDLNDVLSILNRRRDLMNSEAF